MSISIDLSDDELNELQRVTHLADQAEAVRKAVREFLRLRHMEELIAVSGQIEMDDNWRQLETSELAEMGFPPEDSRR